MARRGAFARDRLLPLARITDGDGLSVPLALAEEDRIVVLAES